MAVYDQRHNAFTPDSVRFADLTGPRSSMRPVLDLIDTADPSWPNVAAALREFIASGVDLDEASVAIAVKLGRYRWATDCPEGEGAEDQASLASASGPIVYYIRRGELIKIGTTGNPVGRFKELLPDEILAYEPGGHKKETARHRQFAHLRSRAEYFRSAPELADHIARMRSLYGDPDPSWPTMTRRLAQIWQMPAATSTEVMTAAEAEAELGIKEATIRSWAHRDRLPLAGKDGRRPLYYVEHLVALRDSPDLRLVGNVF